MQRFTNQLGETITIGDWCSTPSNSADYLLIHGISDRGGRTIVWTQEYNDAGCSTGHIIPGATTGTELYQQLSLVHPVATGYCDSCDENDALMALISDDP